MKLSVIGAGYVGLTTAACLAQIGHDVFCSESDLEKLAKLQNGGLPIFEPHLEDVIKERSARQTDCVSDAPKKRLPGEMPSSSASERPRFPMVMPICMPSKRSPAPLPSEPQGTGW